MNQQHKPGLKVQFSHSLSKHEALAAAATRLSIHLPVKEDTTLTLILTFMIGVCGDGLTLGVEAPVRASLVFQP